MFREVSNNNKMFCLQQSEEIIFVIFLVVCLPGLTGSLGLGDGNIELSQHHQPCYKVQTYSYSHIILVYIFPHKQEHKEIFLCPG